VGFLHQLGGKAVPKNERRAASAGISLAVQSNSGRRGGL